MASAPRLGHCGVTQVGEGAACGARDTHGSWTVDSIDDCVARCTGCDHCYYVSYAPGDPFNAGHDDCSWYTSCPATLVPEEPFPVYLGSGHHTVQVRNPKTGHPRPHALHPRLPEARRALHRYQQVLSELGPIPRVLHASFKYDHLNVSESTHPTIVHGLQAFQRHNPRWRVEVSSDTQLEAYLRRHLATDDYARVAPLHPVEKTDVWRLLKMYFEGGIYTDIDRRWNVNVRSFITNATRLVLPTQHGFGISTTEHSFDFSQDFMCSARHNPLFKDALEHVLAQRRKCDERCMLVNPRPHTPACKLPRKKRVPSYCTTLDFGPGAWFRAVTKNLWGEAWLPYSSNESFLPGFNGRTTHIRLTPLAHEFLRVGTPPLIVSMAEDGYFKVITFTPKPGEVLFGVQLPPRLLKGASETERREHAVLEQKALGKANKAAIQAKRQLYKSAGVEPWQESRRRA